MIDILIKLYRHHEHTVIKSLLFVVITDHYHYQNDGARKLIQEEGMERERGVFRRARRGCADQHLFRKEVGIKGFAMKWVMVHPEKFLFSLPEVV